MSLIEHNDAAPSTSAPYSVDVNNGSLDGTVSRQWMSRPADQKFADLNKLHAFKKAEYEASWQADVSTKGGFELLAPEPTSTASFEELYIATKVRGGGDTIEDKIVAPSHWSFAQLCQFAKAPAGFLRDGVPSQQVADMLNFRFQHHLAGDGLKLYGGPSQMRAVTRPTYGRIPDHEIVDALRNIAGDGLGNDGFHWKTPGKLNWSNGTYDPEDMGDVNDRTFYGSDRDLFVFLVDDRRPICVGKTADGRDDNMFRGFYIQNSEVGSRSLAIKSFYLRGVCMNRNLWGCEQFEEITIRHTSMAPNRWLSQAMPALESFAQGSARTLQDAVKKAKAAQLVKDDEEAVNFLQTRSQFSKLAAKAIFEVHQKEEKKPMRSAWDFAQGITAFARSKINTDDRLDVEIEAKKILDRVA